MACMEIVKTQERLKIARVKVAALEQALAIAKGEEAECALDLEQHQQNSSVRLSLDRIVGAGLL